MAPCTNQSVSKALRVFEALFERDFEGRTLKEIAAATAIPTTTAWRLLKTLEAAGWVVEVPVPGQQHGRWRVSHKLASIADEYEQYCRRRRQDIEQEFFETTGRNLTP